MQHFKAIQNDAMQTLQALACVVYVHIVTHLAVFEGV